MKAEATYAFGYIWVQTTSRGEAEFSAALAACKSIGGGKWVASARSWKYPATIETCYRIRRAFGDALVVNPDLRQWFLVEKARADAQTLRSTQGDETLVRLPGVAPTLYASLRPDQRLGVAWLAAGYRGAGLLADHPGTGKTRVTIGGLLEAGVTGPILVLAPRLAVRRVWWREWREFGAEAGVSVHLARGPRAKRQLALDNFFRDESETKVLVCVAEMLRVERKPVEEGQTKNTRKKRGRIEGYSYPEMFDRRLLSGGWACVVADESHRLLGSLTVAKSNLMGEGLAKLPYRPGARRYAVTGTPFGKGGRVQGMFGTLHWLWPDEFTSFWRWADQHFEIETDRVRMRGGRGTTTPVRKVGRLKSGMDEEAFLRNLGPRILRRTKEEVLPWLPPKQRFEVLCEMVPGQERQYRQLSQDAELTTNGGLVVANGVLAERTRAKQVACGEVDLVGEKVRFTTNSGKMEQLWEMLEERDVTDRQEIGNGKIVIASQFVEFLDTISAVLYETGIPHFLLTGGASDSARDDMMDTFQRPGGPRVFLLQSKSGGVSVTLDAADEMFILDELDDPGDMEQLEDRIHRGTRNADGSWNMHQVTIYYFRTEGTIDQAIAAAVAEKSYEQFRALDKRRGLEFTRELIRYRPPEES